MNSLRLAYVSLCERMGYRQRESVNERAPSHKISQLSIRDLAMAGRRQRTASDRSGYVTPAVSLVAVPNYRFGQQLAAPPN